MQTNDTEYIQRAMSVIAHADPELFKAIDTADWTVTVVDGPEDVLPLVKTAGPEIVAKLMESLAVANGVTLVLAPGEQPASEEAPLIWNTWLNRPYINSEAESYGSSPAYYAAEVTVHEFAHHNGEMREMNAYDAGIAFARKMGKPEIVLTQERKKKIVAANEAMESMNNLLSRLRDEGHHL